MIKSVVRKVASFFYTRWCGRSLQGERTGLKINGMCRLGRSARVGRNCNFNGARFYGRGKVTIGHNFHSGRGLIILTENHNYHGRAIPYDDSVVIKDVSIGDNVWLGMNVMILPGVKIEEGVIVQAGAVVSSNIPALSIAGGNPARMIRMRDADHYFTMKKNGCFH